MEIRKSTWGGPTRGDGRKSVRWYVDLVQVLEEASGSDWLVVANYLDHTMKSVPPEHRAGAKLYFERGYDGEKDSAHLAWFVYETDAEYEARIASEKAAAADSVRTTESRERKLLAELKAKYERG